MTIDEELFTYNNKSWLVSGAPVGATVELRLCATGEGAPTAIPTLSVSGTADANGEVTLGFTGAVLNAALLTSFVRKPVHLIGFVNGTVASGAKTYRVSNKHPKMAVTE